ncbi:hypothetical protein Efla_006906 [Eimeria flavescens]
MERGGGGPLGCLCHGVRTLEGVLFRVELRQLVVESESPTNEFFSGVQTPRASERWLEESRDVQWQQKIFSRLERGVYAQPLEAGVEQACPRLAHYHNLLLFSEALQKALLEALFPLEPLSDAQQKESFFVMAQLGGGGLAGDEVLLCRCCFFPNQSLLFVERGLSLSVDCLHAVLRLLLPLRLSNSAPTAYLLLRLPFAAAGAAAAPALAGAAAALAAAVALAAGAPAFAAAAAAATAAAATTATAAATAAAQCFSSRVCCFLLPLPAAVSSSSQGRVFEFRLTQVESQGPPLEAPGGPPAGLPFSSCPSGGAPLPLAMRGPWGGPSSTVDAQRRKGMAQFVLSVGLTIEWLGAPQIDSSPGPPQQQGGAALFHWAAEAAAGSPLLSSQDRKTLEGSTVMSLLGKGDGVAAFGETLQVAFRGRLGGVPPTEAPERPPRIYLQAVRVGPLGGEHLSGYAFADLPLTAGKQLASS